MVPSKPTEIAGSLDPSGRRSGVFVKERVGPRPATRSIESGPGPLSSEQLSPPAASDATKAILIQRCAAMASPFGRLRRSAPRCGDAEKQSARGRGVKPGRGSRVELRRRTAPLESAEAVALLQL